jgi:hypothetical protein
MSAHYLIRLTDESGSVLEELSDGSGFIDDVLVPYATSVRGVARHIDPYGTTSFNALQCEELEAELNALNSIDESDQPFFSKLRAVVARAQVDVHLHLRFLGD